jgi:hypothetical protein
VDVNEENTSVFARWLSQVRFSVVKLIYSCLNARFDMRIIFMANYFLVGGDVPINSETFLITDFINLKIKSAQSFRGVYRDRVCMHVFIEINTYICMSIYIYIIFF